MLQASSTLSQERIRILVSESKGFSPEAAEVLRCVGNPVFADLDREELLLAAPDADVLWVRLRHRIDAEALAVAPKLKAIVSPTTGLNHIDLEAADQRGVRVLSLRGETTFLKEIRATAELTIGLMLSVLRHIPEAAAHVRSNGWSRDFFQGAEIYRKTVGVIGYGRLGRIVAGYLRCFGAQVLATDLPGRVIPDAEGVRLVGLPELLARSEIVSLHVDLNPNTERFFGREQFQEMKAGAVFINTARGELVDEDALLESLRAGRLSAAALDVLSGERSAGMGEHPLVRYAARNRNLLITPHIGGLTAESVEATELFLARKLAETYAAPPALTKD